MPRQEAPPSQPAPSARGNPPLERPELLRGVALAVWILVLDLLLKLLAHVGGCPGPGIFTLNMFDNLWTAPEACEGLELLGPIVVLVPGAREATLLSMVAQDLDGFGNQLWGLGLLALATVLTILVVQWRWHDKGDPLALGVLWAGVLIHGPPRALGDGVAFTEINVMDVGVSLGDLCLIWSLVWLLLRYIGELRAG